MGTVTIFFSGCTSQPQVKFPMPSKVKDYSGYASGNGNTAQFKITNNGNVMIYNDAITGTMTLVRDKYAPVFRGQYRGGTRTKTRTNSRATAYGMGMVYGNSRTSTYTSDRIVDIDIVYVFGDNQMKVSGPQHRWGSVKMGVTSNTKQDFTSFHKKIIKLGGKAGSQ